MKLKNIIEKTISGDWGNELYSIETPCAIGCVRGADIVPIENNAFDTIPNRYVSEKSLKLHSLEVGDIIIEKSGGSPTQSTGRVSYISEALVKNKIDVLCSNFCCAIRIKKEWNSKFVYYFWKYVYNAGIFFNFEGKTSGLKNLQLDNALSSIEIPYYPKPVQDSIVGTLSRIESKIALNREINRNLEAMARQLYDYWFVQFDFPDENGKPYKSSGGKMVWNERLKRYIPIDWRVVSVNDMSVSQRGVSYDKTDISDKGVQVLRGNNIEGNHFVSDSNIVIIPEKLVSTEQHIKKHDIIMTMSSGSKEHVGKCMQFQFDSPHTFGAFLNRFRPTEHPHYLFLFLSSPYFKQKVKSLCNGTGINNLTVTVSLRYTTSETPENQASQF